MDQPLAKDRMLYFLVLYAMVAFIEQLRFSAMFPTAIGQAYIAAAILLLCRPQSNVSILVFALVNIAWHWCTQNPHYNNNILQSLTAFNVLVVTVFVMTKKNNGGHAEIYQRLAPLLRMYVIGVYAFTFFAKLNTDFLDPATSCGSMLVRQIHKAYPGPIGWLFGQPWMVQVGIWGTLAVEILIPIFLLRRQTRPLAIIMGIVFHLLLALAPVEKVLVFSTIMLFMYFVFLSDGAFEYIRRWGRTGWAVIRSVCPTLAARWVLIGGIYYLPLLYNHVQRTSLDDWFHRWFVYYLALALLYVAAMCCASCRGTLIAPREPGYFCPQPVYFCLLIVPLLFNGIAPYLGLKTRGCWAPFSNLRILGPWHNHLIVPRQAVMFQQELVKVLWSDHPKFNRISKQAVFMTEIEFRRLMQRLTGDFKVVCVYRGERITVRSGGQGPLNRPLNWLEKHWLHYKLVNQFRGGEGAMDVY